MNQSISGSLGLLDETLAFAGTALSWLHLFSRINACFDYSQVGTVLSNGPRVKVREGLPLATTLNFLTFVLIRGLPFDRSQITQACTLHSTLLSWQASRPESRPDNLTSSWAKAKCRRHKLHNCILCVCPQVLCSHCSPH